MPPAVRKSRTRRWFSRVLFAGCGVAVVAEVFLQLPFIREAIRMRAEHALAAKIPGATIARCAAADVTGVVRFDGVRIPAPSASLVLDGLEVSLDLGELLHLRLRPSRVRAADLHFSSQLPGLGGISWSAVPGAALAVALVLPPPESPDAPVRLRLQGPSRVCRASSCLVGETFSEMEVERRPGVLSLRFQALGDDVRLASDPQAFDGSGGADGDEDPGLPLPPLAANGSLIRDAKGTRLDAEISVGPHGSIKVAATLAPGSNGGNRVSGSVDCTTDSYLALVDSIPLGLTQVRALGVDGPVTARGHLSGPLADPQAWEIALSLDLRRLRTKTLLSVAPGAWLRAPFLYSPSADPEAPAVWMGLKNPDFMPLEEIPEVLVRAVLLSEDSYFWTHSGFDAEAMVSAMKENLRAESFKRGGSTISQQLAKNLWLSRRKTFQRKFEEALLTIALEASLPKERILEIYLNGIEWGPGLYGVKAAARHYFGKDPRELTAKEAAYLATVIPNPRRYYGYFRKGELSETWEARVMDLVHKMHDAGFVSDADTNDAEWTPLRFTSSGEDPWTTEIP